MREGAFVRKLGVVPVSERRSALLCNVAIPPLELALGGLRVETYKPGEKAPDSGELIEVGPRGGKVEGGRRTVIERGERIPPSSEEGNQFKYKRGSKTTH